MCTDTIFNSEWTVLESSSEKTPRLRPEEERTGWLKEKKGGREGENQSGVGHLSQQQNKIGHF